MREKILEALSKERLDHIELYNKIATRSMHYNKYIRLQYKRLLSEMLDEDLIKIDGHVMRYVALQKIDCVIYTLSEKGKQRLT